MNANNMASLPTHFIQNSDMIICEILKVKQRKMHRPTKDFTDYQFEWKVPHFPGQKHTSLINK